MISWLLIILIVIGLILFIFLYEIPSLRTIRFARKIHGRTGYPLFGNLFTFLTLKQDGIIKLFEDLMTEYPRLSRLEIAGIINIVIKEPEDLQAVLGNINHIHKGKEYVPLEPWLKEGLLTSFGEKWHFRRKLLTPTFHFKILKDSIENINRNSETLSQCLLKTRGEAIEVTEYVTKCTLDIIAESAMAMKLDAQTGYGSEYITAIKTTCSCMVDRILSVWQYKLWLFSLSSNGRTFFKNIKIIEDMTIMILKERKEKLRSERSKIEQENEGTNSDEDKGKRRRVFIDALLEMQQSNPEAFTDEDICEEVNTFMSEGHDTVSAAISFTLYCLGLYHEVQSKVMKELDSIFGDSHREVTMNDTHKMVYLEKVIKETLRLYPSVPYISRTLTQDCVLHDGVVIPKTVNVIMPTYLIHRNERFFPDPEKFDPERFSEEECLNRHPYAYLPFSAGPRNCIGQKFAMLEIKVTLANILRRGRIESVTRRDEFVILSTFVLRSTKPLMCKFFSREPLSD